MTVFQFFKKSFFLTIFFLVFISGCSKSPSYPWYETVSMYHVFIKTFLDSDGDGKGDIKGLISKLDYIRSLNVNTLHMLPIFPALNVDNMPRSHFGYEVLDLKNIHPDYGNIDDFKTLVKEAHKRDLHIVLDFITTVISVQHPFFQDVLNNPNSPYKDWFITSPVIPDGQWMNFNDYQEQFKSSAWKPLPHGGYYYSLWGNSPFLDYHNPKVREYVYSVIDFWLDIGIDGFRIDATKHLYINGPGQENQYHQPENFEFWKQLRKHILEKYGPEKILIAETIPIPNNYSYVVPNREMFDLMFDSTFINDIYPFKKTNPNLLYSAPFLDSFFSNKLNFRGTKLQDRLLYHSDHDGARIATRMSNSEEGPLKTAASLLTLLPAHVKIFAGDEIGIKGITSFANERHKWIHSTVTSMAWNNEYNAGFSKSYMPTLPITDDYREKNVAEQEKRSDSLLHHYRQLLKLKSDYPQLFFKGEYFSVPTEDKKIYAYLVNNASETALVVLNLSQASKTFRINLSFYNPKRAKLIFGKEHIAEFKLKNGELNILNLQPHGTAVFKFGSFDNSRLKRDRTTFSSPVAVTPDDRQIRSQRNVPFLLNIPENGGILRLQKGQGNVSVSLYMKTGNNSIAKQADFNLNTDGKDVLLPVLKEKADIVFFEQDNIAFTFNAENPANVLPADLPLLASYDKNINMSEFYAGKDNNFWYFKMKRNGDILPNNGGLDFILFINTVKGKARQKVSFWKLPEVISKIPVNTTVLYERHIKTGKVQSDINSMRNMGVAQPYTNIIFEQPDAFIAIISREALPQDTIRVAPFVWSAGGRWGDTPPRDKPSPVVERLPFIHGKNVLPNEIDDYLEVQ